MTINTCNLELKEREGGGGMSKELDIIVGLGVGFTLVSLAKALLTQSIGWTVITFVFYAVTVLVALWSWRE